MGLRFSSRDGYRDAAGAFGGTEWSLGSSNMPGSESQSPGQSANERGSAIDALGFADAAGRSSAAGLVLICAVLSGMNRTR